MGSNTSLSQTVEDFLVAFGHLAQRRHEMVVLPYLFHFGEQSFDDQGVDADTPASGHDLHGVRQFFWQSNRRCLLSHAIMIASHHRSASAARPACALRARSSRK